jgi:hypothetical protein
MESAGTDEPSTTPSDESSARAELSAYLGVPEFEHNQWTIEGEIERFGAFARGSHHVTGWRRGMAIFMALLIVAPIAISLIVFVLHLLGRAVGL